MHELGDLLQYPDDEELKNLIVLKPQWVAEHIGRVLVHPPVVESAGVFTADDMEQVWPDLAEGMRQHFLRLMERFDLSYRTLENREVSLVVERLPLDAPDYRAVWDRAFDEGMRELSMHFAMSSVPAGIPTWFIARQHRFTTHTHWRSGAVLRDREDRHVALVAVDSHRGTARLSARGPNPHDFFALLRDGFELTLARFPGLEVTRLIPCPGHLGQPCHHRFDYEHLLKAAHRQPPCSRHTMSLGVRVCLRPRTPLRNPLDDSRRRHRQDRGCASRPGAAHERGI